MAAVSPTTTTLQLYRSSTQRVSTNATARGFRTPHLYNRVRCLNHPPAQRSTSHVVVPSRFSRHSFQVRTHGTIANKYRLSGTCANQILRLPVHPNKSSSDMMFRPLIQRCRLFQQFGQIVKIKRLERGKVPVTPILTLAEQHALRITQPRALTE